MNEREVIAEQLCIIIQAAFPTTMALAENAKWLAKICKA